jgi:PAS domain S-box-containing protein
MLNNHINLLSGLMDPDTAVVTLLQGMPLPMFLINIDGSIRYVNPAFEEMTGFLAYEMIGSKPPYCFWPEQSAKFISRLKTETFPKDQKLKCKQGQDIWCEVRVTPVSSGNQNRYFMVTCVDMSRQNITERKIADLALKSSEAFNISLLQNLANPIWVSDASGSIEYVNPALERLTGYKANEIIGTQPPYKWWPPESRAAYTQQWREATLNQANNIERQFIKKNGEPFWISISHRLIKEDGQFRHYLNNWVDITESKLAREALRISEKNYQDLIENSPFGIRIVDGRSCAVFANNAFLLLYGYNTIEEFNAVALRDRYRRDSYKSLLERRRRRRANLPVEAEYELDIIRKDGEVRHISASQGDVIWNNKKQFQIVYQDITEKTQTERALQESEEKYRTLFETMAQGVISLDAKGKIMSANPAAQTISGLTTAEMRELPLQYLKKATICEDGSEFPPSEIPATLALRTGKRVQDVVMGIFNPVDKKYRWISVNAVPQFHKGEKKPFEVDVTFTDITLLKEAQALNFETEALKRVNRMKTELLANVSHELRTPLASIKGFIETLIEPDAEWNRAQQLDFLESANREADRLTFLIRDLLDMSRLDAGTMTLDKQTVTVKEILEAAKNVLSVVTTDHKLRIRRAPKLPVVKADKTRIAQVITNLVENACKFSTPGSEVDLGIKNTGRDIVFSIKDRGIGMSEETLSQIFNRFYQAQMVVSGKTRGTGLGLCISKGIVESHGGQIQVTSQLNHGSLFSFSIPINGE